jgi:hypothetical protein
LCWFVIGFFVFQFVGSYAVRVTNQTQDQKSETKTNTEPMACITYRDEIADLDPLIRSVGDSGTKIFDTCLAQGLNLEVAGGDGQTLLHLAACWGRMDSVKWLIEHGAPINAVDNAGRTPLMMAIYCRQPELVQVFLDAKANIFIHSIGNGNTARQFALDEARFDKNFEEKLKMGPIARLLESLGSREYLGDKLPASKFDSEILGKGQLDVTGGVYVQLTFLKPNYRFFAVVENIVTKHEEGLPPEEERSTVQGGYYPPRRSSTLFAVMPDYQVVKLGAASDFSRLGIQLRSEADALAFVRVLTESTITDWVNVHINGLELQEIPVEIEPDSCLSVTPEPMKMAGVTKPIIKTVLDARHRKTFVVMRYMIPSTMRFDFGRHGIDHVTRITERIKVNGDYTMTREDIPTPGLVVRNSCILL